MKTSPLLPDSRGFTLIELLTGIAIAAILMGVAVPSITEYLRNSELKAASNSLLTTVSNARSEAIKAGAPAMVVPRQDSNWSSGWRAFVDRNFDRAYTPTIDIPLGEFAFEENSVLRASATAGTATSSYILLDAGGYARTNEGGFGAAVLLIERTDRDEAESNLSRRVLVSRTGRVRVCKPGEADCPAEPW